MTKFELTAHAPFIRIVGRYNVTGKILLLPVAGADEGEVKFGKLFTSFMDVGCGRCGYRN